MNELEQITYTSDPNNAEEVMEFIGEVPPCPLCDGTGEIDHEGYISGCIPCNSRCLPFINAKGKRQYLDWGQTIYRVEGKLYSYDKETVKILHLVSQVGQPSGSVRRCCNECGVGLHVMGQRGYKEGYVEYRSDYCSDEEPELKSFTRCSDIPFEVMKDWTLKWREEQ